MCGIIAYRGKKNNSGDIVLKGLKKLEYRGYDSWGVALRTEQKDTRLFIHKKPGKIGELDIAKLALPQSHLAMAHSRWATHGGVTQSNAHPHMSCSGETHPAKRGGGTPRLGGGRVVVIHNGIIENYLELKKALQKKGHKFASETDTEVAAHAVEERLKKYRGPVTTEIFKQAVLDTLHEFRGRSAFLFMCADNDTLIAARRGSPLIVGKGDNKDYFIASDIPAFLKYTNRVMYLDDDEMVVIDDGGHNFFNVKTGTPIEKRIIKITLQPQEAEKGDYKHFMIKEIMEQKETIHRAINQDEKLLKKVSEMISKAFGTYFIGCGTAGKVCMASSYLFSQIAKMHVNVEFGSEFPNFHHFIRKGSLLIAVSQSGETADTLEAMDVAKKKGAKLLTIVNVEGSSMDRLADLSIHVKAGPEKAVASTKATTAQLAILTLLAYCRAGRLDEGKKVLLDAAAQINDMLNPRYQDHILKLARKIKNVESMYVIGRGVNYPMALESAIKLQEVSYIHAEGFAGGELKHGPIALISPGTPCVVLVANDETREDILSNAIEVKARGGFIIGVSPTREEVFDYWIKVPDVGTASPIVNIIPVQLLAYQLAVLRKNNPDMPRNLAKSVTVK
ncbi:MAG: Glucosamine/fructose-6-phosphate aminotransferase, isomerizing [Candidatus Peregrinibacteria bacterium GW2011_GWA2_47_7]|nr:MAG: Glucosamine/fructose-6-phosphate aminotransferase, isomerizing [Candidatus Peregrinibacteria bacterium GW2011_GWA2_47_7]